MKEQLALLHRLQQTDSQTGADYMELGGLDDGTGLAAELQREEAELSQHEEELAATQAQLHDQQLQLQGTEDDRQHKWDQAYGGMVFDPKELSALEQKIQELDRRKDKLEEAIIMRLDDVENIQAAVAEKQSEVEELTAKLAQAREHFAQRSAQLKAELGELTREREALVGQIQSSLLAEYERICKRSGNIAVAVVAKSTCSVCHTAVAGALLGELRVPTRLVKCENCKRILVLDE